jgi:hypothetical protein
MLLSLFEEKHRNSPRAIKIRIIVAETVSSTFTKYSLHTLRRILFSPDDIINTLRVSRNSPTFVNRKVGPENKLILWLIFNFLQKNFRRWA